MRYAKLNKNTHKCKNYRHKSRPVCNENVHTGITRHYISRQNLKQTSQQTPATKPHGKPRNKSRRDRRHAMQQNLNRNLSGGAGEGAEIRREGGGQARWRRSGEGAGTFAENNRLGGIVDVDNGRGGGGAFAAVDKEVDLSVVAQADVFRLNQFLGIGIFPGY